MHLFVCRYKGPDRHKLYGAILDALYAKFGAEQFNFFRKKNGYGRALMGDGVTVMGTKFINFLCYELDKGSMLCKIRDCTARLAEVGTVESTYIAHEMMASIRYMCNYYFNFLQLTLILLCQNGWSRNYLGSHHRRRR